MVTWRKFTKIRWLIAYAHSTRSEDGLLINFGSFMFEIKKYVMQK